MKITRAIAVAAALIALGAGVWASFKMSGSSRQTALEIGGYVLDRPRELPEFALVDGDGQVFHESDFVGGWSFLYFGYTFCPDICPLSMLQMAELKKLLASSHPALQADYYLVSVDPARDTSERIGEYVRYFDADFKGLTGAIGEIDKLAKAASVLYVIPDTEEGEPYLVGHSSTITLISPRGDVYAVFTSPLKAEGLASDFGKIAARYR
jgi:protein SCO1/2